MIGCIRHYYVSSCIQNCCQSWIIYDLLQDLIFVAPSEYCKVRKLAKLTSFSDDLKGRRTRLWVEQEVHIDDDQEYMDMIVDRTCKVLQEPVDVFVNPFFLPKPMQPRYDELWTAQRVDKVVAVLAKSGKAMEINNRYKIPNKAVIMKAKEAGIKFTFGTNNNTPEVGRMEYAIKMKKECGITSSDMYKPDVKP